MLGLGFWCVFGTMESSIEGLVVIANEYVLYWVTFQIGDWKVPLYVDLPDGAYEADTIFKNATITFFCYPTGLFAYSLPVF